MTDPIADMIIRIKNAILANHELVSIPHSSIKKSMAHILEENGYIESFTVTDEKPQPNIIVKIKYVKDVSVITGVKRLSKPGRRLYSPADKIPVTLNGYGITMISTSKGVMTDKEARKQNLGGELLCQIW